MLSCEICEIFRSNYFEEHLWTTTSKLYLKRNTTQKFSCEFCELFKNNYFVEHLLTAGSETPVRECLFNKVASLTASRLLEVLERDSRQVFLCEFCETFRKAFLQNTNQPLLTCFFPLFFPTRCFFLKSVYLGE